MNDCYLCQKDSACLCVTCSSRDVNQIATQASYLIQTTVKLREHLEKRILVLTQKRAKEIKARIKLMREAIQAKYKLIAQKKEHIAKQQEEVEAWSSHEETTVLRISEAKTTLDTNLSKLNDQFCGMGSRNAEAIRKLTKDVATLKRSQVLKAGRYFDIFECHYPRYSVGNKEFQIEKVSLLQRHGGLAMNTVVDRRVSGEGITLNVDYVMIDRNQHNNPIIPAFAALGANDVEQNSLFQTAVQGNLNIGEIKFIQDYIDLNQPKSLQLLEAFPDFQENIEDQKQIGRPRASTMEAFDNFQGETSSDPPLKQRRREDSELRQEMRRIKEEYQSSICLIPQKGGYPQPSVIPMGFTNLFDTYSSSPDSTERYDRIQGAIHALTLLVGGLANILALPLPYALQLTPLGFTIFDACRHPYPLFLNHRIYQPPCEFTKHLLHFEKAIVLLDKSIQFILFASGHSLPRGSNDGLILNIAPLFDLSLPPTSNCLGKPFDPVPKREPKEEEDRFEVLSMVRKDEACCCLLPDKWQSSQKRDILGKESVEETFKVSRGKSEWSDDEQYVDLLEQAKNLNKTLDLSSLIQTDYLLQEQIVAQS